MTIGKGRNEVVDWEQGLLAQLSFCYGGAVKRAQNQMIWSQTRSGNQMQKLTFITTVF